jgi:hypothetical protein
MIANSPSTYQIRICRTAWRPRSLQRKAGDNQTVSRHADQDAHRANGSRRDRASNTSVCRGAAAAAPRKKMPAIIQKGRSSESCSPMARHSCRGLSSDQPNKATVPITAIEHKTMRAASRSSATAHRASAERVWKSFMQLSLKPAVVEVDEDLRKGQAQDHALHFRSSCIASARSFADAAENLGAAPR